MKGDCEPCIYNPTNMDVNLGKNRKYFVYMRRFSKKKGEKKGVMVI